MLEYWDFEIILTLVGSIVAQFYFISSRIVRSKINMKIVAYPSIVIGIIVFVAVFMMAFGSFWEGNFMAPVGGLIFGFILGAIAFVLTLIVLTIGYLVVRGIKQIATQKSSEDLQIKNKVSKKFLYFQYGNMLLMITLIVYCVEITRLKSEYGNINSDGLSKWNLSEDQIRKAHGNFIFRNHNLFLRGLLFRENVPKDIILDIYRSSYDNNVIQAVVTHPNSRGIKELETIKSKKEESGFTKKIFKLLKEVVFSIWIRSWFF